MAKISVHGGIVAWYEEPAIPFARYAICKDGTVLVKVNGKTWRKSLLKRDTIHRLEAQGVLVCTESCADYFLLGWISDPPHISPYFLIQYVIYLQTYKKPIYSKKYST
jgi:hypothetical protein